MLNKSNPYWKTLWESFRRLPFFIQLLVVVPTLCAVVFTFVVGNIGLALMGTAVAIPSLISGWFGGFFMLVFGKACHIIAKDRQRTD